MRAVALVGAGDTPGKLGIDAASLWLADGPSTRGARAVETETGAVITENSLSISAASTDRGGPRIRRVPGHWRRVRARQHDGAGRCICGVVMPAGAMIDRIPAAPRRAPFETVKLIDEPPIVEQLDLAAVQQR